MNFYIFSPSFLARARSFSRIAVTSSSILTIKRSFCIKFIKKCSKISEILTYINGITRCFLPQPNGISWNAQHGAESCEPTEAMSPPRKFVVQVLDGCPLHNVEDENALKSIKISKKNLKKSLKTHKANSRR